MEEYRPTGPYVIQSGKNKDKVLELLMFQKYWLLIWWIKKFNENKPAIKNRFHRHIEWLLQQGENRQAVTLCPQCKQYPVKFFSSLGSPKYGYSIYPIYTCCESELCQQRLFHEAVGSVPNFYPVKFSSIMNYRKKFDQKMVVDLLKAVYKMPKRITAQVAFDFFVK